MGTDSNTLILAFVGGSVSTLLLDYAYDLPYLQIINSNNIGISIMQGLAGSFGVVLCVPPYGADLHGAVLWTSCKESCAGRRNRSRKRSGSRRRARGRSRGENKSFFQE